jgi:hypothetical protein
MPRWIKFRVDNEFFNKLQKLKEWKIKINLSHAARTVVYKEYEKTLRQNRDVIVKEFIKDAYEDASNKQNRFGGKTGKRETLKQLRDISNLISGALHNYFGIRVSPSEIKRHLIFLESQETRKESGKKIADPDDPHNKMTEQELEDSADQILEASIEEKDNNDMAQ